VAEALETVQLDEFDALAIGLDLDQFLAEQLGPMHDIACEEDFYQARQLVVPDYQSLNYQEHWQAEKPSQTHEFVVWGMRNHGLELPLIRGGLEGILRIKRAAEQAKKLVEFNLVTTRSERLEDMTIEYIDRHFSGVFESVEVIGNALPMPPERSKGYYFKKMGRRLEKQGLRVAKVFGDDLPGSLYDCAREDDGQFICFGDYNWNRGELRLPERNFDDNPRRPRLRKIERALGHAAFAQRVIDTHSLNAA
jgi:hypothetical protein